MSNVTSLAHFPAIGDPLAVILNGKVVQRSRNLRGLISRAGKVGVVGASVWACGYSINNDGHMLIRFADGSWCRVHFASFTIARDFLRSRWQRWGLYAEVRNSDAYWSFI